MKEVPFMRKLSDMPIRCSSCRDCAAQGCSARSHEYDPQPQVFSRRSLVAGAGSAIAFTTLGSMASAQETDSNSTPEACIALTPEQTEGPYYIDDLLLRDDITEDRPGVPLELTVFVIDIPTCQHIPDAAVDIWHCDALGDYSGFGNQSKPGDTFMRGVQLTDQGGAATINTVYPGWYVGRATHIHIKVHTGGSADDGTYIGGATQHTGQLYFDDEMTDQIAMLEPYAQRLDIRRTRNQEDGILNRAGINDASLFVQLTPLDEDDLAKGFKGTALVGIDASN